MRQSSADALCAVAGSVAGAQSILRVLEEIYSWCWEQQKESERHEMVVSGAKVCRAQQSRDLLLASPPCCISCLSPTF